MTWDYIHTFLLAHLPLPYNRGQFINIHGNLLKIEQVNNIIADWFTCY